MRTPVQPSLFDAPTPLSFDATFTALRRVWLDDTAWIDWLPGWLRGADTLFERLHATLPWAQRSRMMYDKRVLEPRLTSPWSLASGRPLDPDVDALRLALGARYGVTFDSMGANLYRDGHDSVAWHGDRIVKEVVDPIVPLVSLGAPRRFFLRPKSGGPSVRYELGHGDLLVTGGATQRTWDHAIPKVAHALPRISLAFRYGLDPLAYAHKRVERDPDVR